MATLRKNTGKLFEIYDRIGFGAIGLQSDIESIRVAAVDFAHREGYSRSEEDVTGHRVVTALTAPLKRAFGEIGSSPFVIRGIFAEVGDTPGDDNYYRFEYDGDFSPQTTFGVVAGTNEIHHALVASLNEKMPVGTPEAVAKQLVLLIKDALEGGSTPLADLVPEAVLIERAEGRENRFRTITTTA